MRPPLRTPRKDPWPPRPPHPTHDARQFLGIVVAGALLLVLGKLAVSYGWLVSQPAVRPFPDNGSVEVGALPPAARGMATVTLAGAPRQPR